ncbi:MAG: PQQ-binding-like beta-propeller repeat protein [Bacteroidales bacterium]|jgi:outer membrane protein assembly factor BamB|nr:PQQ-binding-like beta-propeller repeat protein [Bacteroidales bacterium]
MNKKNIIQLITLFVVLIFTGAIVFWHFYTPDSNIVIQNPGADNRPEGGARKADEVVIGEFFMRFGDVETHDRSSPRGQWPCFRGTDYKNIAQTTTTFNFSSDFPVQWKVETGEGYAAPVIYNGLVYILDYDERLSSDMLRCFDLETGTELWRRWYRVPMKRNHGFSRTAPVVTDKYVITAGPMGHVMCCDRITGELKWTLDMQNQFETEVPHWYSGQCPRVENNQVILAPAGKEILMLGADIETGEIAWQTPNSLNYKMSHSSIMPMTLQGKKTFVYAGIGGICGVSAESVDKGKLLWNVAWPPSVIAPSPLQLSSDKILMTAGYGSGGAVIQVNYTNGKWSATMIDRHRPNEGVSSEQQTPILYEQMVITVPPKDGGGIRGKLVAYSPSNLRTPIWESASDERFGLGPYFVIGNHLFAFKDDGELFVYQLQQRGMTLVKRQRILDGRDGWGPMAYADGYLLLKDSEWLYCLKID